jgi:hypothetical protein
MKFDIIIELADHSVGIFSDEKYTVDFDDFEDKECSIFDKNNWNDGTDPIEKTKKFLSEMYDVPVEQIVSEKDYEQAEIDYLKAYDNN